MITLTVLGEPLPQGSKSGRVIGEAYEKRGADRWVKNPRAHLTDGFGDKPRRLKEWRERVALAARRSMQIAGASIIDGPVVVAVTFYLPRAKNAKKKLFHDTKPDVDKLQRAVGDALEGVAYVNDSRIAKWIPEKKFADEWPHRTPGAYVTVRAAGLEDHTHAIQN